MTFVRRVSSAILNIFLPGLSAWNPSPPFLYVSKAVTVCSWIIASAFFVQYDNISDTLYYKMVK